MVLKFNGHQGGDTLALIKNFKYCHRKGLMISKRKNKFRVDSLPQSVPHRPVNPYQTPRLLDDHTVSPAARSAGQWLSPGVVLVPVVLENTGEISLWELSGVIDGSVPEGLGVLRRRGQQVHLLDLRHIGALIVGWEEIVDILWWG